MELFIKGNVRFCSLAKYRYMEDNGSISDVNEGISLLKPNQNILIKIINPHNPTEVLHQLINNNLEVKFDLLDYSHLFIFCSSYKNIGDKFRRENPQYKYFVKFSLDEFNIKLKEIINGMYREQCISLKNNLGIRSTRIGFRNRTYLVFLLLDQYQFDYIQYYDPESWSKHKSPLFMKECQQFSHQKEYRHVVYIDYPDITDSQDIRNLFDDYMTKRLNKKLESRQIDIDFIKSLDLTLLIDPFSIYESGEII